MVCKIKILRNIQEDQNKRVGILLVNLGTPDSPNPKDVRRYLLEFLTDGRVIDLPWLQRQLLVRGAIVPRRYKQSAASYKAIWTDEGSPLMAYTRRVKDQLQEALPQCIVEMAMRYQNPSIEKAIDSLLRQNLDELVVLPLFPQYASATTGSIYQRVMEVLGGYLTLPRLTLIDQFATHPQYIKAICEIARAYPIDEYDHILFSFHGLPRRQLVKGRKEPSGGDKRCYSAQCYATAQAVALQLGLKDYTVCFQSRLGKEPWMEPYTSDCINLLAVKGAKRVLVFCPSFVADCLETIFEIGVEYAEEFKHAGGERLDYVRSLNDHPQWVKAIQAIVSTGRS